MELTKEEESILGGNEGEILSKLMRLLVELGDSYGAEKLIEIKSAHTVLNFGLRFVASAAKILRNIAEAGLKVKVRTTTDPIIDKSYQKELEAILALYQLQDQLVEDLTKIGVSGFTCTPYYIDNKPEFGDHCAWAESSAVIYLNSVIGARSNREGGLVDVASAITGKTPYYGLHLTENRKGEKLFRINLKEVNGFDLTSIGLKIGKIAGSKIPVIEGLKHISDDDLKNLGAASAASGAVALIHVIGKTPEAKTIEDAFQTDKPEEIIDITREDLNEMQEEFSEEWDNSPLNIGIGCPQLSRDELISILKKLEGKKISEGVDLWLLCCQDVIESIKGTQYFDIAMSSGTKISSFCPMLAVLPRPYITNSGKTCVYTNATYRSIDDCIKLATEGK